VDSTTAPFVRRDRAEFFSDFDSSTDTSRFRKRLLPDAAMEPPAHSACGTAIVISAVDHRPPAECADALRTRGLSAAHSILRARPLIMTDDANFMSCSSSQFSGHRASLLELHLY